MRKEVEVLRTLCTWADEMWLRANIITPSRNLTCGLLPSACMAYNSNSPSHTDHVRH
jgi:hypothetical protein